MRRTLTRRQWIATTTIGAAAVIANACVAEPNRVTITRHQVGRVGPGTAIRLAQLSDLHLQGIGRLEEGVAEAVAELAVDLILLTGDSIDRDDKLPVLHEFLALLPHGTPKVAILGNWEHWAGVDISSLRRVYERYDCELLCNKSILRTVRKSEVLITGLDDLVGGKPNLADALVGAWPHENHLGLAHCPAHRDLIAAELGSSSREAVDSERGRIESARFSARIMLAGHTHGGQVNVFGWAPFRPYGSGRYVSGWYRENLPELYVSRGLGTSVIPARFGSPPEVAYFEWGV